MWRARKHVLRRNRRQSVDRSSVLTGQAGEADDCSNSKGRSVSVVIATLDRCNHLANLLDSLRWQTHRAFEVVVVVGPSTDNTVNMLQRFHGNVRVAHNDERNLNKSRNVGVSMARGEILAFIDDDEIPEPQWLASLVEYFSAPSVGSVGGAVLGPNGRDLDWLYCSADMYGRAYLSVDEPTHHHRSDPSDPAARRLQYFPGGNCAIRRTALNSIGGFDERIPYYLDETDTFFRLKMAGWDMVTAPKARLHHLYLAGITRAADDGRTTNWTPVVQSRAYFSTKYALPLVGMERVIEEFGDFTSGIRASLADREAVGLFDSAVAAAREALQCSQGAPVTSADCYIAGPSRPNEMVLYPTIVSSSSRHIVAIDETADERAADALESRLQELSQLGHSVRSIRAGSEPSTRWHKSIWRHTISPDPRSSGLAEQREVESIATVRPVDELLLDCAEVRPQGSLALTHD